MSTILIQALLLATSGLFSIGSITLIILLLISEKGWQNGFSYALGYTGGYALIGLLIIFLGFQTKPSDSQSLNFIFPLLFVVLGTLLLYLSIRNKRKPLQDSNEESRFFSIVNKITPAKAFVFGGVITVINFKNLALFLSAISIVVQSQLLIYDKIIYTLLVVLVFCSSVIIPVGIYLIFPTKRIELLEKIKQGLNNNRRSISIWIPFIFGLIFISKGILDIT